MKTMYAKTVLYFYSGIAEQIQALDEFIEEKALSSMNVYTSALDQCCEILRLTYDKENLIKLGKLVESTLNTLNEEDLAILDYNYIKNMDESEYEKFDFSSRNYFRKKKSAVIKFASILESQGITDAVFEKDYLSIKPLKNFYKSVCCYEDDLTAKNNKISVGLKNKNFVA